MTKANKRSICIPLHDWPFHLGLVQDDSPGSPVLLLVSQLFNGDNEVEVGQCHCGVTLHLTRGSLFRSFRTSLSLYAQYIPADYSFSSLWPSLTA